mgnify:CR=1 FL=1
MLYFHSWSGGKDSTASVILDHIHGLPPSKIIFSEVMFDKKRGISGELPEHIDFVMNKAKPLFESWGYTVEIVHAEKDYLDLFFHVLQRSKVEERIGKHVGWLLGGACAANRDLKIKPIRDYYKRLDLAGAEYRHYSTSYKRKELFNMTDTLILFKPLADFGETLKKDCPKNDCIVYRNIYERYCEEYADYKRIKEAFADLSEATIRTLEHAIRTNGKELYAMWFENYAVLKQRAALGMAYGGMKPKRATLDSVTAFDAITKDKPTLAGFLRSLPCIEAPWDAAFQKRYCSSCTAENCDACANEQFRNNPEWWLSLPAAEVEQ